MLRKNSCQNGRRGFTQFMIVDVPVNERTFEKYFGIYVDIGKIFEKSGCKISLTIQQLSNIFGKNWHIFVRKNTTTHQRVIGDVSIHY